MDDIPCPVCPLGELEITETRRDLHCAICGYYESITGDEDE
jgi:hypothetical protein